MRVLHVYKIYLPEDFTGVPTAIHELSKQLIAKGIVSDVLTTGPSGIPEERTVDGQSVFYSTRNFTLASTSFSMSIFRRFKALSATYDVVHYHFPWPVGDLLALTQERRKPSLVTYHSDIVRQKALMPVYRLVQDRFLHQMQAIVATSPDYARTSAPLQKFAQKVRVIPIGMPERTLPGAEKIAEWKQRVGTGFFLFIGAARYYKGVAYLLEAARQCGRPVVIVGAGHASQHRAQDQPANVTFTGTVSDEDKEALIDLCGGVIMPSHLRSEAFGISLVEAARAGKPMISCEIGTGTSYINIDRVTGLTTKPADPTALADAMSWLSDHPEKAQVFGAAARQRYEELFTASDMADSYMRLYESLSRGDAA